MFLTLSNIPRYSLKQQSPTIPLLSSVADSIKKTICVMQVTDELMHNTVNIKKKEQIRRKSPKTLLSDYEHCPHS